MNGEYEFLPLKYEFKHAGSYEISEVVQGDDLAGETVKAAEVLHVNRDGDHTDPQTGAAQSSARQRRRSVALVTVEDQTLAKNPRCI